MICRGCGGVLGRDCWNESECVWISEDLVRRGEYSIQHQHENEQLLEKLYLDLYNLESDVLLMQKVIDHKDLGLTLEHQSLLIYFNLVNETSFE